MENENEKTNHKISRYVAFILIILAIGVLVFSFWVGLSKKAIAPVVSNMTQEEKKAENKPIDTSNWKLYQNTAYGFELKYPTDWEISTLAFADPATFSAPIFSIKGCMDKGSGACPSFMVGNIHKIEPGETIESDINFDKNDSILAKKELKISGEEASFIEYYQARGEMGVVKQEMKMIHNGTMYRIYITEDAVDTSQKKTSADWEYKDVLDAMLASFRFNDEKKVSSVAEIVSGVVYKNEGFGFSVNLPEGWEKYKVSIQQDKGDDKHTYIYFLMPSTDKNAGYFDKKTGKIVPGFAEIFVITATDLDTWNKDIKSKECIKNPNPECPDPGSVLDKNEKYVFSANYGNGILPKDVQKFVEGTSASKFLSGKFKLN